MTHSVYRHRNVLSYIGDLTIGSRHLPWYYPLGVVYLLPSAEIFGDGCVHDDVFPVLAPEQFPAHKHMCLQYLLDHRRQWVRLWPLPTLGV